ncbi:hypothetical protein KIN20_025329 [Parelaphostrongylus tenuis]|uniref:Uncharacterized protein n=1 Tax=Parelaphostrongylus tenuis TaxID=148309 RepID=A0AAD5NBS8_PARTN|nr:hypothetical protein KIN20_025329 [Parelaphostrongylus tenuis]
MLQKSVQKVWNFIHKRNLKTEQRSSPFIKPSILLGCDQLWTLMKQVESHIQFPSGLYLLPTTIEYLCTGAIKETNQMHGKEKEHMLLKLHYKEGDESTRQMQDNDDDMDEWDGH